MSDLPPHTTSDLFDLDGDVGTTSFRWTPARALMTPRDTLQGGAGLGAALAAMERATGRPTIWATAQYLSFSIGPAPVDLDVAIEVTGHHTSQARCVVSRDGDEVLTAHAALGTRPSDSGDVWCARPDVAPPAECPPFEFFGPGGGGLEEMIEIRLAHGRQLADVARDRTRGDGSFAVWVRCWTEPDHRVAVPDLTFIGDFMPMGFSDALGKPIGGNSLDNTVRVGDLTTTGWVLLSCHVDQVARGFGHGHAEMWAEDGTLLGIVSQTVILR